jgi:pyruvate kinase
MSLLKGSDIHDLKEMYKKFPYEYISIPCVQSGTDLQEFKLALGKELAEKVEIVSKIDTIEGVQNFEAILEHTNAIII